MFCEQTCHHPPRSSFLIEGPDNKYKVHGWNEYSVKAYLNSAVCTPSGHKTVVFQDGQSIKWNNSTDTFYNTVMGTLYHWVHGKIEFRDSENEIYAWYNMGQVKKKSQEYFEGEIVAKGKVTDKISGNYCGYIDFNNKRWFDVREVDLVYHHYTDEDEEKTLPSDCVKRTDSRKLSQNLLAEA